MKPFKKTMIEVTGNKGPFSRSDRGALFIAGQRLSEQYVLDILDELDDMSRKRDALPEWDGDSSDDMAYYQEDLAALLAGTCGKSRKILEHDSKAREHLTSLYISLAIRPSSP